MQKLTSILLATLLLLSSSGLTYGQHYCGGKVVAEALSLGEKKLSCGGVEAAMHTDGVMPGCCQNIYHTIQTDGEYMGAAFDLPIPSIFVVALAAVFAWEPLISTAAQAYTYYDPPPLYKDIPVLYQVFLI